MNTFMNELQTATNFDRTANGALAHKTTQNYVYDLFGLGGAYRKRSDEDCILLFKNAFEQNETLALKCLFYLRDCRGGQGERRFFRVCYHWLCKEYPDVAIRNMEHLPNFGRWDDMLYASQNTEVFYYAMGLIKRQLALDVECKTPSLLAKWLPSENASSKETKAMAQEVRHYLSMTHRQYRKTLSILRKRINIVERLMSENRWDEIEFDKIPSKAGLKYKNAFAHRDIIAKKYEAFAKDKTTKVNATTLYPYDVVAKATAGAGWGYNFSTLNSTDRAMIEKYWENLPDYLNGNPCKMLCIVDTSSSMICGGEADSPLHVAVSLGMYCAERIGGPFKDHYISFSRKPRLVKVEGVDFVDKVRRIYKADLCENTNLEAAFDLVLKVAKNCDPKDIPETLVVISDMQIDRGSRSPIWDEIRFTTWTEENAKTEMEKIREKWTAHGLKCPKLVYWNVNASKNTFLDAGPNVTFVSGCSPVIFEQVMTGVTGWDLCLKKIDSERYSCIK